ALAAALREGNIGAMDFYNLQNVIADTQMRESIGKVTGTTPEKDKK
ncbi:MAG: flotillin-like FloA family protein, partial [Eubacteriales bacterium]|nr:flotillin-like FloA family protein [Eubacteriales bacterium]